MPSSRSKLLNPNSAEPISPKGAQAAQASRSSSTEHPATPAKLAPAMDSMAPTSLGETASGQRSGYAWQWECNFRAHTGFQRRGEHGRRMAKLRSQSAWEG